MGKDTDSLMLHAHRVTVALDADRPVRASVSRYGRAGRLLVDMHHACEFGVVLKGAMRRSYAGCSMRLSPGGVWFCGPMEPHGWRVEKAPAEVAVVLFQPELLLWTSEPGDPPYLAPFLSQQPKDRPQPRNGQDREDLMLLARSAADEFARREPHWLAAVRLDFQRLLLLLLRRSKDSPSSRRDAAPTALDYRRLRPALDMIVREPDRRITVGDAARAAGLSRSQFAAIFSRTMGTGFARFLARSRLAGAAREVARTDVKLSAIAARWSFADASHLHRQFVRHFGFTPGQLRRRGVPGGHAVIPPGFE